MYYVVFEFSSKYREPYFYVIVWNLEKKKLWNQNQFLFGEEILNLFYYFKQVVLFSSLDNLTRELSQIIVTNKKNVVNDFFFEL